MFCINVLSTHQHEIAKIFSGDAGTAKAYDFDAAQWEFGRANVARLIGAIATFDCELEDAHTAGTHRIFIGRVCNASTHSGTPLLHTNRSYGFPLKWE
jgi:flavin reductase (DIM6/NTAB) family NADH-FMN oxidoreductase RutF